VHAVCDDVKSWKHDEIIVNCEVKNPDEMIGSIDHLESRNRGPLCVPTVHCYDFFHTFYCMSFITVTSILIRHLKGLQFRIINNLYVNVAVFALSCMPCPTFTSASRIDKNLTMIGFTLLLFQLTRILKE
jgi:hypothetical protein